MLWWLPRIAVMDIWQFTEKVSNNEGSMSCVYTWTMLHYRWKEVSQAECSAQCIFDAHWFVVEHQLQSESLCYVILMEFLDEYYMLCPYMNTIPPIGINICLVKEIKVSLLNTSLALSSMPIPFATYMRWPIQFIINDNSQDFSFSHLYNTSSIYRDIARRNALMWITKQL